MIVLAPYTAVSEASDRNFSRINDSVCRGAKYTGSHVCWNRSDQTDHLWHLSAAEL